MEYDIGHGKPYNGSKAIAQQHNKVLSKEFFYQYVSGLVTRNLQKQ